jgi:hypothetical protein
LESMYGLVADTRVGLEAYTMPAPTKSPSKSACVQVLMIYKSAASHLIKHHVQAHSIRHVLQKCVQPGRCVTHKNVG